MGYGLNPLGHLLTLFFESQYGYIPLCLPSYMICTEFQMRCGSSSDRFPSSIQAELTLSLYVDQLPEAHVVAPMALTVILAVDYLKNPFWAVG